MPEHGRKFLPYPRPPDMGAGLHAQQLKDLVVHGPYLFVGALRVHAPVFFKIRALMAEVIRPEGDLYLLSGLRLFEEGAEGCLELAAIALPAEKMEADKVVAPESYHSAYSVSNSVIEFK